MVVLNNELEIRECQEHRVWIHSKTLGFGKWISTLELVMLIKSKSKKGFTMTECNGLGDKDKR